MTILYFKKIINRINRLEWLTERVSIETEYDEDADSGILLPWFPRWSMGTRKNLSGFA